MAEGFAVNTRRVFYEVCKKSGLQEIESFHYIKKIAGIYARVRRTT